MLAEPGPGADVADKGAGVKITALRAFPTGPKTFVRIETNLKVTGWGEVTGSEPKVAAALADLEFDPGRRPMARAQER